jgi:hypothetical protein
MDTFKFHLWVTEIVAKLYDITKPCFYGGSACDGKQGQPAE